MSTSEENLRGSKCAECGAAIPWYFGAKCEKCLDALADKLDPDVPGTEEIRMRRYG